MINNYLLIRRFLFENFNFLKGGHLTSAFSQEKDKIVLSIESEGLQRWLEMSFLAEGSFLNMYEKFFRAKKNTINFFSSFLPCEIISVKIHKNDRILRLDTTTGKLLAFLRSHKGNLIFLQENGISLPFLKSVEVSDELLQKGLSQDMEEISSLLPNNIKEMPQTEGEIRQIFPYINSSLFDKLQVFSSDDYGVQRLKNFITHTLNSRLCVVAIPNEKMRILPEILSEEKYILAVSDSVTAIYKEYRRLQGSLSSVRKSESSIVTKLRKDRDYLEKKLAQLESLVFNGDKSEENRIKAELLLINMGKLKRGLTSIQVENIFQQGMITIELAKDLTPEQNAEEYFKKSRQAKITFQKALNEIPVIKKRLEETNDSITKLENMSKNELHSQILGSKISSDSKVKGNADEGNKFRKFLLPGGFMLYVGKDSKNNDELTLRFARQEDIWLHARGVSGSHVIIRNNTKGVPVPKNIIKLAASIAAYFSKAKTAGVVPVVFTQKKYVVKKKGMNPGQVALLREEVVLVRPEIPVDVKTEEKSS